MTKEQIQNQIDRLRREAETGEQWAEICALEAQMLDTNDCQSECDCGNPSVKYYGPHDPDCHSFRKCDEEVYCDKHFDEASKENAWMLGVPLSAITGVMSDEDKQELRDAGRGHLV